MGIILNCLLLYFIIFICLFIWTLIDDYIVLKKYGKETYQKFKPYDYKVNLFLTSIWLFIFIFGIYVFIKHYIFKKD